MKRCFKCLCEKPLEAFYRHARMGDGHLNKCKECTKRDVAEHRQANLEKVRAYDKMRASAAHRVASRKEYAQTPAGKEAHRRALLAGRLRYPDKAKARYALSNAVRDGKIERWPCEVCGARAEAHHPHYGEPLLVTWLCKTHHTQAHALLKEAA
jgi:hypothetical protein